MPRFKAEMQSAVHVVPHSTELTTSSREETLILDSGRFPIVRLRVKLSSISGPKKEKPTWANRNKSGKTFYNLSSLLYRSDGHFIDYRRIP